MNENTSYQNENIQVSVEQFPGCQVKLTVNVQPQGSKAAYKKAIKMINKEVSLPGFRKGRAPEAMVIEHYASYIDKEWKNLVVETAFHEALQLCKVYPFSQKTIKKPDVKSLDKESGGTIVIEFERTPEVPEILGSDLTLTKPEEKEVTQEKIDENLELIQLHNAEWEDVEGRGVEKGDFVDVKIVEVDNPENVLCENTRFEVKEGKMGEWMIKLILGKNVNDKVEGMSERSPEMPEEEEFKPTNCEITLLSIKTPKLPPLDDELAKKVGVKTHEELLEKVKQRIELEHKQESQDVLRKELANVLTEKYLFEVPESFVGPQIAGRLQELRASLKSEEKTAEEIEKEVESKKEEIAEEIKKDVRLQFITRWVADDHKIEVTEQEIIQNLLPLLYQSGEGFDPENIERLKGHVHHTLLTHKVHDHLIERASIQ